eukprot:scpid32036/ scgid2233/ 
MRRFRILLSVCCAVSLFVPATARPLQSAANDPDEGALMTGTRHQKFVKTKKCRYHFQQARTESCEHHMCTVDHSLYEAHGVYHDVLEDDSVCHITAPAGVTNLRILCPNPYAEKPANESCQENNPHDADTWWVQDRQNRYMELELSRNSVPDDLYGAAWESFDHCSCNVSGSGLPEFEDEYSTKCSNSLLIHMLNRTTAGRYRCKYYAPGNHLEAAGFQDFIVDMIPDTCEMCNDHSTCHQLPISSVLQTASLTSSSQQAYGDGFTADRSYSVKLGQPFCLHVTKPAQIKFHPLWDYAIAQNDLHPIRLMAPNLEHSRINMVPYASIHGDDNDCLVINTMMYNLQGDYLVRQQGGISEDPPSLVIRLKADDSPPSPWTTVQQAAIGGLAGVGLLVTVSLFLWWRLSKRLVPVGDQVPPHSLPPSPAQAETDPPQSTTTSSAHAPYAGSEYGGSSGGSSRYLLTEGRNPGDGDSLDRDSILPPPRSRASTRSSTASQPYLVQDSNAPKPNAKIAVGAPGFVPSGRSAETSFSQPPQDVDPSRGLQRGQELSTDSGNGVDSVKVIAPRPNARDSTISEGDCGNSRTSSNASAYSGAHFTDHGSSRGGSRLSSNASAYSGAHITGHLSPRIRRQSNLAGPSNQSSLDRTGDHSTLHFEGSRSGSEASQFRDTRNPSRPQQRVNLAAGNPAVAAMHQGSSEPDPLSRQQPIPRSTRSPTTIVEEAAASAGASTAMPGAGDVAGKGTASAALGDFSSDIMEGGPRLPQTRSASHIPAVGHQQQKHPAQADPREGNKKPRFSTLKKHLTGGAEYSRLEDDNQDGLPVNVDGKRKLVTKPPPNYGGTGRSRSTPPCETL